MAGIKQYERWSKLENPDTVFTAQKNGNLPNVYLISLKIFAAQHEQELLSFLHLMKQTSFDIHRNNAWLERAIKNKKWL